MRKPYGSRQGPLGLSALAKCHLTQDGLQPSRVHDSCLLYATRTEVSLASANVAVVSIEIPSAKVASMRPTLVVNPVGDRAFSAFAEQQLSEGYQTIPAFQARLRVLYPQAVVHARELAGELTAIWYVYRDGHWTSTGEAGR